jgi:hypothetical protein
VKGHRYSVRKLRFLGSWMLFTLGISIPQPVIAQAVPYARTYAKSNEEVDKALKEMQAYAGQKLPIVDGFVANTDQPLNRYERAFYQFSIDLLPATSGGTVVRVTAKITAWYVDRDPWKSGYQVLPSNGRLELDLLDRLSEKFASKPSSSTLSSDLQAPKPNLDLSPGLPRSPLPSNRAPAATPTHSSEVAASGLGGDEITALRAKRQAEENRMRQLNTELQSLQDIQRNQAHPLNLVLVKKTGTPVLARPAVGSHILFTAAADDEFEFIDADGEWIHVQISGVLRGYIRRNSLDLPEFVAAHLKSPNKAASEEKPAAFRIEREENSHFPGDWEPLKGKMVKIYTVQPVSPDQTRICRHTVSEICRRNPDFDSCLVRDRSDLRFSRRRNRGSYARKRKTICGRHTLFRQLLEAMLPRPAGCVSGFR